MRPPLPFFFTTSWVIYVRAGCRLFLLSFSHLTSRTQVQACRKFLFFNLSDAGLKHFIISHCADPLFRVMSNGARVFTAFRLRFLFEIIFKFPRYVNVARRHTFIRGDCEIILIDLTYIPGDATISRSYMRYALVYAKSFDARPLFHFALPSDRRRFCRRPAYRLITDLEKTTHACSLVSFATLYCILPSGSFRELIGLFLCQ